MAESHPTMGAWIEIPVSCSEMEGLVSRTPRWVRGLKYRLEITLRIKEWSHPTMGAWIEIPRFQDNP